MEGKRHKRRQPPPKGLAPRGLWAEIAPTMGTGAGLFATKRLAVEWYRSAIGGNARTSNRQSARPTRWGSLFFRNKYRPTAFLVRRSPGERGFCCGDRNARNIRFLPGSSPAVQK